jgi:uncharacterized phage protein (TIGR02220 family)
MARARNIKPGLFKNEILGVEDPIISLLFIGLWTLADKAGRIEDRPLRIKGELFPYREKLDVDRYLTKLEQLGFIIRYSHNELRLIQIVNFLKHQNPHHTEKESEYPEYSDGCELTVKSPLNNGYTPADSLIPDSLIPDSLNSMSGKPDPVPHKGINGFKPQAIEVLNFLNTKTGRNYQPVEANLKMIAGRLKEGASVADCRAVIAKKVREWGSDAKMSEYLRPATLFNATKFAQYRGELVESSND